jgi:hypothetical protein
LRRYEVSREPEILKHDRKVRLIEEELLKSSDGTASLAATSTTSGAAAVTPENSNQESFENPIPAPIPIPEVLTAEEVRWDHQKARVDLHCKIAVDHEISTTISRLQSEVLHTHRHHHS